MLPKLYPITRLLGARLAKQIKISYCRLMPSVSREVEPQSFLLTRAAWLAGELSLSQLLAMPRRPEVVGAIAYPEFDQTQAFDFNTEDTDLDFPPKEILRGTPFSPDHPWYGRFAEVLEVGFRPALQKICQHATEVMGINLDETLVGIRMQSAVGDNLRRTFGITHFDMPIEGYTLTGYSVANRASTAFATGPFNVPPDTDIFVDERRTERLLNAQRHGQKLFPVEPYKIILFDETLPHEVPPQLINDPHLRTFLRVTFQQLRPDSVGTLLP